MDLETVVQKFVDGEELSISERKYLLLSLTSDKSETVRFRVSKAEKLLLVQEARRSGFNLSEYLRSLTIKQLVIPLMTGDQDTRGNF
jgi:hypothetical protein